MASKESKKTKNAYQHIPSYCIPPASSVVTESQQSKEEAREAEVAFWMGPSSGRHRLSHTPNATVTDDNFEILVYRYMKYKFQHRRSLTEVIVEMAREGYDFSRVQKPEWHIAVIELRYYNNGGLLKALIAKWYNC